MTDVWCRLIYVLYKRHVDMVLLTKSQILHAFLTLPLTAQELTCHNPGKHQHSPVMHRTQVPKLNTCNGPTSLATLHLDTTQKGSSPVFLLKIHILLSFCPLGQMASL